MNATEIKKSELGDNTSTETTNQKILKELCLIRALLVRKTFVDISYNNMPEQKQIHMLKEIFKDL
jgi:hypothetical protein